MKDWRLPLGVFALALLVRGIYLLQSSTSPAFDVPMVDSESYHTLALALVAGDVLPRLFYQGPFYPLFLAGIYAMGGSILAAKIAQIVLASATCALTALLGRRLFGPGVGLAAGIVAAMHAVLVFFDGELLATSWSAFWSVALLWLVLEADAKPSALRLAGVGLAGALATATRGTFLPFVLFAALWLMWRTLKRRRKRRFALRDGLVLAAGFALVAAPLVVSSGRISGHYSVLPHSGALNLYIGNNPEWRASVATRPVDFFEIGDLPHYHGARTAEERQRWYSDRVIAYALGQPLAFGAGLLEKTIQFASPRELPRNIDIYVFRQWSSFLAVGVWKLSSWGFPNGVLFPLALLGIALHWRRVPAPVVALPITVAASVIVTFVSARYRVALVPVAAILACAGVAELARMMARGQRGRAAAWIAAALLVSGLSALPGPFAQEQSNYEAELHYALGRHQVELFTNVDATADESATARAAALAREHLSLALELDPQYAIVHATLGVLVSQEGDYELADRHFRDALRFDPTCRTALVGRIRTLSEMKRSIELARHIQHSEAVEEARRQAALAK